MRVAPGPLRTTILFLVLASSTVGYPIRVLQAWVSYVFGASCGADQRHDSDAGAAGRKFYSFTLTPASLINFAHCGISDLIIAANSTGVLATTCMPRSCRCLRTSFCARTRAVSR